MRDGRRFQCPTCKKIFTTAEGVTDHHRKKHFRPLAVVVEPQEPGVPSCVECGGSPELTNGEAIYPHRPDLWHKRFWRCACGAYVGCHGHTERPLGRPAGPETRRARGFAHAAFDPLWQKKAMPSRRAAYTWLAGKMDMDFEDCHIGHMSRDEALAVVRIVRQHYG